MISNLLRHRFLIIRLSVLAAVIGGMIALLSTPTYTSDFSFTPQESSGAGGLSALASGFGVNIGTNEAQSPEFYMDLIHTRELLWRLLDTKFTLPSAKGPVTFTLLDSIQPSGSSREIRRDKATQKLSKDVMARPNYRTSVVVVGVRANSPQLALQLSERLLVEINRFNAETRQSRAAAQRAFAEQRVAESRIALRNAEDRSTAWLSRNKIFTSSPELQYEKGRLDRELALRDQEYIALMQQYQAARMEEVRNTPVITIVERPALAARANSRGVLNKTILGGFMGFLLALFVVVLREILRKSRSIHHDGVEELALLRAQMASELRHPANTLRQIFLIPERGNPKSDQLS